MPISQSQRNRPGLIHTHTARLTNNSREVGQYYHASVDAQSFIQAFIDSGGDPFHMLGANPLVTGFKIFFHFDATSGLLADEIYTNSALAYLRRVGLTNRYELLKKFIKHLSKLTTYSAWVFQTITGLDEAWKVNATDYYYENELEITCLETLDWRIQAVSSMYRQIVEDDERGIEVLPVNLKRFSMSVYIYDFRNFAAYSQTNIELLQTVYNQDLSTLNHVLLDFGYCEFMDASGSAMIGNTSNNDSAFQTNNIVIKYNKAANSGLFRTITGDVLLKDSAFGITSTSILGVSDANPNTRLPIEATIRQDLDDLQVESWRTTLGNTRDALEDELIALANNRLSRLYLGNVHGFTPQDVVQLASSADFVTVLNRTNAEIRGTASLNNRTNFNANLGNIHD